MSGLQIGERWERLRSVPGLFRSVLIVAGMLLVGTAFFLYIVINLPGKAGIIRFGPGDHPVDYKADFTEAPAIAPGTNQEVRIAGVAVGDITGAEVTKGGGARLTLSLKPGYARVYDNAHAVLKPKSPLMDMYVLLDPGGPPGRLLKPGEVIPVTQTVRPVPIDEVLSALDERARHALGPLFEEASVALAQPETVPAALRAGTDTLTRAKPVLDALATRRERVARLVTSLADIATAAGGDDARLAGLLTDARTTLDTLVARDTDLDATLRRLPGFTAALRDSSADLRALTGELNPVLDGVRSSADQLPDALAGLRGVVDQLDGTLRRAGPVVAGARPLVADLRPLVGSARTALGDLAPIAPRLDPLTANVVRYLPATTRLIYQLTDVLSWEDNSANWIRGIDIAGLQTLKVARP